MPSGAKKRKAAKKKLQKSSQNNNNNGSHSLSQGYDNPKPRHDRASTDGGEVKTSDKFDDVTVVSGDDFKESHKRNASEEDSSSSSGSSSDDDEVKVEKENSGQSSYSEATRSSEPHELVDGCMSETRSSEIPLNVEVTKVVPLPQELNFGTPDLAESQMEQNMDEILPLSNEQTRRDTDAPLPKDSGATTLDRDGINGQCKEPEKHSSSEEQPLVSTGPLPVHRTSWMNCCGLLDVLSGDSSR